MTVCQSNFLFGFYGCVLQKKKKYVTSREVGVIILNYHILSHYDKRVTQQLTINKKNYQESV